MQTTGLLGDALVLVPEAILDSGNGTANRSEALVISGERVLGRLPKAEVPALAARTRILSGGWILPGFVNLHDYLSVDADRPDPMGRMFSPDIASRAWSAARALRRDLRSGVTTLRVMGEGDGFDLRAARAVREGEIEGPALVTSGFPITPSHGHQRGARGFDGEEAIRHAVRENIRAGADWIKLVLTGGVNSVGLGPRDAVYTRNEIRHAIDEARRAGRAVAASAHGGPAVRMAAEEGVATIEHAALFDAEDVEAVALNGVTVVLTLSRFFAPEGIRRSARDNPAILANLERACAAMRALVPALIARGVPIAIGTDNMHGHIGQDIAILAELGAGIDMALAAATSGGAAALRRPDIGGLGPRMIADLVVLPGDPRHDPALLTRPVEVFARGRAVFG